MNQAQYNSGFAPPRKNNQQPTGLTNQIDEVFDNINSYNLSNHSGYGNRGRDEGTNKFYDNLRNNEQELNIRKDQQQTRSFEKNPSFLGKLFNTHDHYQQAREKQRNEYYDVLEEQYITKEREKRYRQAQKMEEERFLDDKLNRERYELSVRFSRDRQHERHIDYNKEGIYQSFDANQEGIIDAIPPGLDKKIEREIAKPAVIEKNDNKENYNNETDQNNQNNDYTKNNMFNPEPQQKLNFNPVYDSPNREAYRNNSNNVFGQQYARDDQGMNNMQNRNYNQENRNYNPENSLNAYNRPNYENSPKYQRSQTYDQSITPMALRGGNRNTNINNPNNVNNQNMYFQHPSDANLNNQRNTNNFTNNAFTSNNPQYNQYENNPQIFQDDVLPLVPTAKEIMASGAQRDVRHEILNLRGQILMNQGKLEQDLEKIKMDAVKSGQKNHYGSYENKTLQNHFDSMPNLYQAVGNWAPGNPTMSNTEHKYLVNITHGVNIPKLDFNVMIGEINERLRDVRNPIPTHMIPQPQKEPQQMSKQKSDYTLLSNEPSIPKVPKFDPLQDIHQTDFDAINIRSKYLDTMKYPMISNTEPTSINRLPMQLDHKYPQNINNHSNPNNLRNDQDYDITTVSQNIPDNHGIRNYPGDQNDPNDISDARISQQKTKDKFKSNKEKSPDNLKKPKTQYDDSYDIPEELNSKHSGDTIEEIFSENEDPDDPDNQNPDGNVKKQKRGVEDPDTIIDPQNKDKQQQGVVSNKKPTFKDKPTATKKSYTERVREQRDINRKMNKQKRLAEKGQLKEDGEEINEDLNDWGDEDGDYQGGSSNPSDQNIEIQNDIGNEKLPDDENNQEIDEEVPEDMNEKNFDRQKSSTKDNKWHDVDQSEFDKE